MNDHDVGTALRRQLLADLQRGRSSDPRRLQALVGDFCGDDQAALLPALKYLVLTPQFSRALQQSPPLPLDPQLLLQFRQSLAEVFAAGVCSRMEAVLRGLLALPAAREPAPSNNPGPVAPRALAPLPAAEPSASLEAALPEAAPLAGWPESGGSARGLVAVLSFIAGVLVVGVLGALLWLMQLSRVQRELPRQTATEQQPTPPPPAAPPSTPQTTPAEPPPAPDLEQLDRERAMASVQQLYADLSAGNTDAARQRFSAEAADQFDPTYFGQFARVAVDDLVETDRKGPLVSLTGIVTLIYPDGTSQREARLFSVDTASDPPLVTASSFDRVVSPRQ
jgi:hypothetical protein